MVRIKASDPDYEAIAAAMHALGVWLNPHCWMGVNDIDAPFIMAPDGKTRVMIERGLRDIFDDLNFRRLTHELD